MKVAAKYTTVETKYWTRTPRGW